MLHLDLALLPQMHRRVLSSLGLTFLMTSSLGSVPCGGGGGRCVQRGTGEVIVLCLPPSLPLLGNTLVTVLTSAPV